MPTPSYQALKKQILELQEMVACLSTDPDYGITTRQAIRFELPRVSKQARWLVLAEIGACELTEQEENKRMRKALRVRHADVLLKARWAGDEIIVILGDDPDGFIRRLRTGLSNAGISATFAITSCTGILDDDVHAAEAIVAARKNGYDV